MALEVRSDFDVKLMLRQPDGSIRNLGRHHGRASHEDYGEGDKVQVIPHLHRVSPDGGWLASFDPDSRTVYVAAIGASGVERGRSLRVEGLDFETAEFAQFRWFTQDDVPSSDGETSTEAAPTGFVFMTGSAIRYAPVTLADLTGASRVKSHPVFTGPDAVEREVHDTRVVPGGFMVRSHVGGPHDSTQQLHVVRIADGAVQEVSSLLPHGVGTSGANVGLDGRVVVSVHPNDYEDRERLGFGEENEFWTWTIPSGASPGGASEPTFDRSRPCPGDDYCWVTNWAPHSSPLVTALEGGVIGVTPLDGEGHSFEFDTENGYWGSVHALWAHGGTILAANDRAVRSFELDGTVRWSWEAPEDDEIVGVHEDHADGSALVSVGRELLRVRDGKARRVLRAHGKYDAREWVEDTDFGGYSETFIDQALPLPGGAIAYTVVDLDATYHEIPWEMELSPEELAELEAEEAAADRDGRDEFPELD